MPLQATSGAASYDAFGGGVPVVPKYIEEYFSTFLYSGTGASQTITNNIDLSTKGGLVWLKARNDTRNNWLYDTVRGKEYGLRSDLNFVENYSTNSITAFNNNGFSIGDSGNINTSGNNLVSWSWAKAPKFFDVVTWTSTNNANARISHNLGSVPGCYIIKRTDGAGNWFTYHTSLGRSAYLSLNATNASASATNCWGTSDPTTTDFGVNETFFTPGSGTYVAYLFAHNAGGFGLTGTDNVISCGSFTSDGSGNATVNLGWEPQWVLWKESNNINDWKVMDTMRGFSYSNTQYLRPNSSGAEVSWSTAGYIPTVTATGFQTNRQASAGDTFIYIAIRRGPMKVPTDATKVFAPVARTGTGTSTAVTTPNFPPDMLLQARRGAPDWPLADRLRGAGQNLATCYTSAESTPSPAYVESFDMTGATLGSGNAVNGSGLTYIEYFYRRAPSFFDEVCYTGTGSATTVTHNLGVVPELMIVKSRSAVSTWIVYAAPLGNTYSLSLNQTTAQSGPSSANWNSTTPTSTQFSLGAGTNVNGNGNTFVAYLFATCAGVSKVGSYTGNGSSQTINCGFTGGARFILIKQTTTASNEWFVWDTARGIVSGNDPLLALNRTWAEDSTTDSVDTDSSGFIVNQNSTTSINNNGETYIFLAIA